MNVSVLRPDRYSLALAIVRACLRHRAETVGEWERDDADRAARGLHNLRWEIAGADHEPLAYAAAWEVRPRRFRFDLVVRPEARLLGLGRSLFQTILAAAQDSGGETLQARADSADAFSLSFLHRRSFREVHRMVSMRGSLPSEASHVPVPAGVEILTADECERIDADFWPRLHSVHLRAAVDWPDPDPGGVVSELTLEGFRRRFAGDIPASQFFVARVSGSWVGYAGIAASAEEPGMASTGPTAVDPAHRARGIATALKAAALSWAARAGFSSAESRSANPALMRVNAKLGFECSDAEVRLVRPCFLEVTPGRTDL